MLFLKQYWQPIRDGEVTVAFRRWKSGQVLAGRRYRTASGIIEVESINEITDADVTDDMPDERGIQTPRPSSRTFRCGLAFPYTGSYSTS